MKTLILPVSSPDAFRMAIQILNSGGIVAFPTDTVYGLGALAFDGRAVEGIYAAKARPVEKAIPVLLSRVDDLHLVAASIPEMALTLASSYWPGPLTLVIPKHPTLPEAVSSALTVGVRVPADASALALLRMAGPMAVTSANLSGQTSPSTAEEVLAQLGGRIPLILDGGRTPGGVPSTVVDCTSAEPKVLRQGPISEEDIERLLGLHL
jgi:L-threonylcarbamoyladenylate synthase